MIAKPRPGEAPGAAANTSAPRAHHFRGSLGRFATGVAIVTFDGATKRHGITVNSFTSVSMEPPLVLVSIARTARAHDELAGRPFAVNILGAEQRYLATHFAGWPGPEPRWVEGGTAPRLAGVLAYFECRPWAEYDGGDHTLYLGEVVNFDYRSGDALAFANGSYTTIPESQLGMEDLL
ncbi:flavin reductase (DIM6/NTAB) family NADH-FMN oxidoreductase RutF [Arthrobacter sp. PvP102]|uniref:flavin reductase family protein n=1 Tax=unclassified Arthrobacter TaxID=235627 RepID=UPI0000526F5F|nr:MULTISPECIES: flavin reductase family protein [unclassified Arthrobacter]ABK03949.1 flavin reductase domain protein, FMN-binding protein [Arthrobacter sp. FB24]MBP1231878.1 flavin reductase (DIM6/NTAB) family NADH-FMN oxidoreductase RutF [Arthrobacter sp. PvP103]MBP1237013.1 flavin reductase (DIM6/NTAB) family NADH-FMN oxidoreductase RutF [Arthrobacter sp. PvP102]